MTGLEHFDQLLISNQQWRNRFNDLDKQLCVDNMHYVYLKHYKFN